LESYGAFTIDADGLSHRAIEKGAPGYSLVVNHFGAGILDADGEINRAKLGKIVFHEAEAMKALEEIVHPLVRQAINLLIKRSSQSVVVIEAIKLLEGDLRKLCDSIWVTYAPESVQIERLTSKRDISREEAQQRIDAQSPQNLKIAQANIVIRNIGSYDDLWKQVTKAWKTSVPPGEATLGSDIRDLKLGETRVSRGKPGDSDAIAVLINHLSGDRQNLTGNDVMAKFSENAYTLLKMNKALVGIAGWQVENLVVRTTDLYLEPGINIEDALELLIHEIEQESANLQCEVSLVFPHGNLAKHEDLWKKLGYEIRSPDALGNQAWMDAARESMPPESVLHFKQLTEERVLHLI